MSPKRPRVLIVAATSAYQVGDISSTAERMGVDVSLATDRCHVLAEQWPQGALAVDLRDPSSSADAIAELHASSPIAGIIPTDEQTAIVAAVAAARLDLLHNSAEAVRIAANKMLFRDRLSSSGLLQPRTEVVDLDSSPLEAARTIGFPVVVKPLHLSGSRGVMRADDEQELLQRVTRLRRLLADPDVRAAGGEAANRYLIESFVPGPEMAIEALLRRGKLEVLALFDKPEALDGPFFAETIYTTPSVVDRELQDSITQAVAAAARAIGLREGPVHAEVRTGTSGPVVIELAARSIGGLCARTLRFDCGVSLEEVVIAHAIGRPLSPQSMATASGVLMLPVPRSGVLTAIEGVDAALSIDGIEDVVVTARVGDNVEPLPEGRVYLGFAFARAATPAQVTRALREARSRLTVRITPRLDQPSR